jgi:uncharacterized protein YndB with AHSA1/START domain
MTQPNEGRAQTIRTVEDKIEIAAPVEAVWQALTEAEELARWFPLDARVTPDVGGKIWLSWGDWAEWDQQIKIWEPGKHLQTTYASTPAGLAEKPPAAVAKPIEIAIDFYLESRAGGTVLRVVHSGFGKAASWDNEYYGVMRGWRYELQALRHYLEKHPGVARRVAWVRSTIQVSAEEMWETLTGADGFFFDSDLAGLEPGDRYSLRSAAGEVFRGVVRTASPPFDFSGTVENLGDSLLRIAVEGTPSAPYALLWLATYGLSQIKVDELQAGFQALLEKLTGPS